MLYHCNALLSVSYSWFRTLRPECWPGPEEENTLHLLKSPYIGCLSVSVLIWVFETVRPLRSSGTMSLLVVPEYRNKTFGEAAFSYYALSRWNSLSEDLRAAGSVNVNLETTYSARLLIQNGLKTLFIY